jgi:hypothetical protein
MSRWTAQKLPQKARHKPHVEKRRLTDIHNAWVIVHWHPHEDGTNTLSEYGRSFQRNGQEMIRIHDSGKVYFGSDVRRHATVEERELSL